jgi:hypothetical protein
MTTISATKTSITGKNKWDNRKDKVAEINSHFGE